MSPYQGYSEARKLLTSQNRNCLQYMNRAFRWPKIKPDDGKALQSYFLFLTGCNNAMQEITQLTEMDSPTNLRNIVSKLPYKMREKMWRVSAFDIQEKCDTRAKFSDLVTFINRRAKIAVDPVFGDIKDAEDKGKYCIYIYNICKCESDKIIQAKGECICHKCCTYSN